MNPPAWCPSCNAEIDPQQDFCMECGEPIAQARRVGEVTTTPEPAPTATTSAAAAPAARPKRRVEEPEAIRCPGCGTPSARARCPGCGTRLRDEEE